MGEPLTPEEQAEALIAAEAALLKPESVGHYENVEYWTRLLARALLASEARERELREAIHGALRITEMMSGTPTGEAEIRQVLRAALGQEEQ